MKTYYFLIVGLLNSEQEYHHKQYIFSKKEKWEERVKNARTQRVFVACGEYLQEEPETVFEGVVLKTYLPEWEI